MQNNHQITTAVAGRSKVDKNGHAMTRNVCNGRVGGHHGATKDDNWRERHNKKQLVTRRVAVSDQYA